MYRWTMLDNRKYVALDVPNNDVFIGNDNVQSLEICPMCGLLPVTTDRDLGIMFV